eukprot:4960570-Pyramimonas_sp.AAC.1
MCIRDRLCTLRARRVLRPPAPRPDRQFALPRVPSSAGPPLIPRARTRARAAAYWARRGACAR